MDEIIEILEKNAKMTPEDISKITGKDSSKIKKAIEKYEKSGVILRYKCVVNKKLLKDAPKEIKALIEVNVVPQKNKGFDYIAEKIYRFPEVVSCYLLSGSYDLLITASGEDIHTISDFVSEKLAPMEGVRGTVTHILLKKYKEDGDILIQKDKDKRLAISY